MKTATSGAQKARFPNACVLALLAAVMPLSVTHASVVNGYLSIWDGIYPDSESDNASCQLCHTDSPSGESSGLNPYGNAIKDSDAGDITARILAVEGDDSDTDPTGSDNKTEIDANAQPGWKSGDSPPPPGIVPLPYDPTETIPPTADANGPYSGSADVPITFDGTGSEPSAPERTIVSYDWDFGDGNAGTGPTSSHTYATDGTYSVTLTVTDDAGGTGSDTTSACLESLDDGTTLITKEYFNTGTEFDSDTRGSEVCVDGVNGCLTRDSNGDFVKDQLIPYQEFPFSMSPEEINQINNTPGFMRLSVFLAGDITTVGGSEESVTVEYNGMVIGEPIFDESADTCEIPTGPPPHEENVGSDCGPNFATDYVAGGNVIVEGIPIYGSSDIATNPFGCKDNDRSVTFDKAEFLAGLNSAGEGVFKYKLSDAIYQAKYFGSRLEFVAHELRANKQLQSGPVDDTGIHIPVAVDPFDDGGILIKHLESQHFAFTIRFSDDAGTGSFVGWKALDVIPAEFDPDPGAEEGTYNNFVPPGTCSDSSCDGVAVTEGNCTATINPHDPDRKLDPHFVRVQLGDTDTCEVTVWVRTSENPASGKRGRTRKYAPTSCDIVMGELLNTFTLNEGVKVFDTDGEFRFSGPTDSLQLTCNW